MKRLNLITALFIDLALPSVALVAQQPYFEEENFTSPASQISLVNGIAADVNNCIWLTTQSGIYRYDGNRFRHYSALNTPAIRFERMQNIPTVLRHGQRQWAIRDAKGNLYEIDSQSRLQPLHTNPENQTIFGQHGLEAWRRGIKCSFNIGPNDFFEVHYVASRKLFYVLDENGDLDRWPEAQLNNSTQRLHAGNIAIPKDPVTGAIYHYRAFTTNNALYFLTATGLMKLEDSSDAPRHIELKGDILLNADIIDMEDAKIFAPVGNASVVMWLHGNIYELKESLTDHSFNTRLLAKGLDSDIPSFLFYSPVHQLLMGCFLNRGLVLYRPHQFSLLKYAHVNPGINGNYYYTLLPSDSGYITVNKSGIIWLGLNGTSRVLSDDNANIFFLYRDKKGNLWYQKQSTDLEASQLMYLQAGTNRKVVVHEPGYDNNMAGMYQFDDSTYFVLTDHTFEKLIVGIKKTSAQTLIRAKKGEFFNSLFARDRGTFWLGYDQGLIEYSLTNKSWRDVPALAKANVRVIAKLGWDNYVAGTYDKWIYEYKQGNWKHLSSSDKAVASSAHGFIIDSITNSMWVSSNNGIVRIPLNNALGMNFSTSGEIYAERFSNFGKDISAEFNGSNNYSSARLSDTSAAFANAAGLVVFNPRQFFSSPLPVNVLIEPVDESDSLAKKDTNNRQLRFSAVVPYFGNRGNLEVLYRLTQSDEYWHTLFANSIISYNNLTPGRHELQFRIKHYSDPAGKEVFITAAEFDIAYRWYEKAWFKISIVLLALAILISFHYFRIWYILKRKRALEKLVSEKTEELQETNNNLVEVIEELSISESSLKQSNFLKDEYYAVLTHDLRSPLKFLSYNISQLMEHAPSLQNEVLKKGLFAAHQCSTDVYKLIDEFVYWIQDNEKQLKPQPTPASIAAIVEDARKMYEFNLEDNKNKFVANIPADFLFTTDPKLLFIILRNAIDNANKYTVGGTITVSAVRQNDSLQIVVADTGRGISEDKVKLLMELQYAEVQLSYKQRKSLGFYIMAILTKLLGGNYTIASTNQNGTSLYFSFPELKEE